MVNLVFNETTNTTNTTRETVQRTNYTTLCQDVDTPYDLLGYYRRAPAEQRYAWREDELLIWSKQPGTRAVVSPLAVGEWYIFRVAPILVHQVWAGPASVDEVLAPPSAYSYKELIQVTGPGPPRDLHADHVGPHSMRLSWSAPEPAVGEAGIWHGDGGRPLIGYRIFMGHGPVTAAERAVELERGRGDLARPGSGHAQLPGEGFTDVLLLSTTETEVTLSDLPPQTLLRLTVAAENTDLRGLNSTALSVATGVLRATLFTDCGYASADEQPVAYEGCFRDFAAEPDMPRRPAEMPEFSSVLTPEACETACAAASRLYFGLTAGGGCSCADEFGRYGAVEDSECNTPCTGEPRRACGGKNRTSVYRRAGRHGVLLGAGEYRAYDLIRMRLADDALSSVRLPAGLRLTLFMQDGTAGVPVVTKHPAYEGSIDFAGADDVGADGYADGRTVERKEAVIDAAMGAGSALPAPPDRTGAKGRSLNLTADTPCLVDVPCLSASAVAAAAYAAFNHTADPFADPLAVAKAVKAAAWRQLEAETGGTELDPPPECQIGEVRQLPY